MRTLAHLIDVNWLQESWNRLRKGAAVGIDAVNATTYAEDLDNNLQKLLSDLKTKRYQPAPVRRVYIPKADGKQRPLGLPTIEDKIAQNAVTTILTAIYEQEFLPMSYGFRPNKNAHQAFETVKAAILMMIKRWLKAGVMEDGKLVRSSSESPQGGVISPILANIYLHYVLDLWIERVVKKHLKGEIYTFRYADDGAPRAQRRLQNAITVN